MARFPVGPGQRAEIAAQGFNPDMYEYDDQLGDIVYKGPQGAIAAFVAPFADTPRRAAQGFGHMINDTVGMLPEFVQPAARGAMLPQLLPLAGLSHLTAPTARSLQAAPGQDTTMAKGAALAGEVGAGILPFAVPFAGLPLGIANQGTARYGDVRDRGGAPVTAGIAAAIDAAATAIPPIKAAGLPLKAALTRGALVGAGANVAAQGAQNILADSTYAPGTEFTDQMGMQALLGAGMGAGSTYAIRKADNFVGLQLPSNDNIAAAAGDAPPVMDAAMGRQMMNRLRAGDYRDPAERASAVQTMQDTFGWSPDDVSRNMNYRQNVEDAEGGVAAWRDAITQNPQLVARMGDARSKALARLALEGFAIDDAAVNLMLDARDPNAAVAQLRQAGLPGAVAGRAQGELDALRMQNTVQQLVPGDAAIPAEGTLLAQRETDAAFQAAEAARVQADIDQRTQTAAQRMSAERDAIEAQIEAGRAKGIPGPGDVATRGQFTAEERNRLRLRKEKKDMPPEQDAVAPVPEPAAAIAAQIAAVADPASPKAAAIVTPGSQAPAVLPPSVQAVETPRGTAVVAPAKADVAATAAKVAEGSAGRELGMSQARKPADGEYVVQSLDENGNVLSEEVVNAEGIPAATKAANQLGKRINILSPEEVVIRREEARAAETAVGADEAQVRSLEEYLARKRAGQGTPIKPKAAAPGMSAEPAPTPPAPKPKREFKRTTKRADAAEAPTWTADKGAELDALRAADDADMLNANQQQRLAQLELEWQAHESGKVAEAKPAASSEVQKPAEFTPEQKAKISSGMRNKRPRSIAMLRDWLQARTGQELMISKTRDEMSIFPKNYDGSEQFMLPSDFRKMTFDELEIEARRQMPKTMGRALSKVESKSFTGERSPDALGITPDFQFFKGLSDDVRRALKGRVFISDLEKEFASAERPFKMQQAKDGGFNVKDLTTAVSRMNAAERGLYEASGLTEFLKGKERVSRDDVLQFMEANGPKLEIKELDATPKVSEAELAYNKMKHEWYDSSSSARKLDIDYYLAGNKTTREEVENFYGPNTALASKLREFAALYDEVKRTPKQSNDSATARYSMVNPRELADMPGAVDILVRIPKRKRTPAEMMKGNNPDLLYSADNSHYPQSGDNLLTHVRAYEHTLPDGRRVLRVFEIQSDWAQQVRKAQDAGERDDLGKYGSVARHPLLPHTNKLGLKAAMEIARKRGLDGVVIDDAETAMLTEGHDRAVRVRMADVSEAVRQVEGDGTTPYYRYGQDYASGTYVNDAGTIIRVDKPESNFKGLAAGPDAVKIERAKDLQEFASGNPESAISQAKGMRHNYDGDLQRGARDLSGVEGVPVELGEHKNAFDSSSRINRASRTVDDVQTLREDLIFRNPDGTPKTTSTGRFYPIDAPIARRATGEPFSMTGRLYSNPLDPDLFIGAAKNVVKLGRQLIGSPVSKLRAIGRTLGTREGDEAADAVSRLAERREDLLYEKQYDLKAGLDGISLRDRQQAFDYMKDMQEFGASTEDLSIGAREALDVFRDLALDTRRRQNAEGPYIQEGNTFRPGELSENYVPQSFKSEVWEGLAEGDAAIRSQLETHLRAQGYSPAEIKAIYRSLSTEAKDTASRSSYFGPIRKPEGVQYPREWLLPATDSWLAYLNRWSADMAMSKVIEQDPRFAQLMGIAEDGRGNTHQPVTGFDDPRLVNTFKSGVEAWLNSTSPRLTKLDQANSLASGLRVQHESALTDVALSPWSAAANAGMAAAVKGFVRAITPGSFAEAREKGQIPSFHRSNSELGSQTARRISVTRLMDKFREYSGLHTAQDFTRVLGSFAGEEAAIAALRDKDANFFKRLNILDPFTRPEAEVIRETSNRIQKQVTSSYDVRDTPEWAQMGGRSQVARTIFSLSRFAIGQTNRQLSMMAEALKQGDPTPLITMATGGLLTKAMVDELKEELLGKKPADLSWSEWFNLGRPEPVRFLVNQLSGANFGGFITQLAAQALNFGSGVKSYAPKSQAGSLAETVADHFSWLKHKFSEEGEITGEDAVKLFDSFMKDTTQDYRLFRNAMEGDPGDARERGIYRRLEKGEGSRDLPRANPLTIQNRFAEAETPEEVNALMPEVVERILAGKEMNVDNAFGDPEYYGFRERMEPGSGVRQLEKDAGKQLGINRYKRELLDMIPDSAKPPEFRFDSEGVLRKR